MKLIFFDTETTGLEPGSICQLSYIILDVGKSIRGNNLYFTVDYVEPGAESVHGLSVEKLQELSCGKKFKDIYKDFIQDFFTADVYIGHNIPFDIKFMETEVRRCNTQFEEKNIFCTMRYYKDICKLKGRNGKNKYPKLADVVKFLNIDDEAISNTAKKYFNDSDDFHDARYDTAATFLLVTEGIKQGYIAQGYFTQKYGEF